jgi:DNA modification methylase
VLQNQIVHGDCVQVMASLPGGVIDLTVTSPPYDALRDYDGYTFDFEAIATQLFRVTKKGGVVVWVVGDETIKGGETGTSFRQALFFQDVGFRIFDTMIYEKTGTSFPTQGKYTQIFEYMFVLSKGKPKTFNPIKDIPKLWAGSWGQTTQRQKDGSLKNSTSKSCGKANVRASADNPIHGYKQRTNIWRVVNGKKFAHTDDIAYEHPATFPESLARDHIVTWTNPGDQVLDPMCGSGTTCKMARKTGRNYTGIDTSMKYCAVARRRTALLDKEKK